MISELSDYIFWQLEFLGLFICSFPSDYITIADLTLLLSMEASQDKYGRQDHHGLIQHLISDFWVELQ